MQIFNKLQNKFSKFHFVTYWLGIANGAEGPPKGYLQAAVSPQSRDDHRSSESGWSQIHGGGGRRHLSSRRWHQDRAGLTTRQHLPLSSRRPEPPGTRPVSSTASGADITYSTTKLRMYSRSFCRWHWGRKVLLSSKTDTLFCLVSLKT